MMKTLINILLILFIIPNSFSQNSNSRSESSDQNKKHTYIKGGYGIDDNEIDSKIIEKNSKQKEKLAIMTKNKGKITYHKGGYGTNVDNQKRTENGKVVLSKKVNSKGQVITTYVSKSKIKKEEAKEEFAHIKRDDVLKVEKNRNGNTIVTYKSRTSNRNRSQYYDNSSKNKLQNQNSGLNSQNNEYASNKNKHSD
ncbi:MAG: hypothetical protein HN704_10245 [Bacteroidetes bacterium]|jgi:hypothetical protein|nr:hypothetical protein [Bacteroidota bacterium]MBT7491971.1 hypothetical protein [Bacteroidota bacterium]